MIWAPLIGVGWYLSLYFHGEWHAAGPWPTKSRCETIRTELSMELPSTVEIGKCFQPYDNDQD